MTKLAKQLRRDIDSLRIPVLQPIVSRTLLDAAELESLTGRRPQTMLKLL